MTTDDSDSEEIPPEELQSVIRDLPRLDIAEASLFDDLRGMRLGNVQKKYGVRLEQERIGFGWIQQALAALAQPSTRAKA